ncbi:Uncharacterised protein [Escherichia coli]|nr:Uncharacterised protein [Escherichia coli]
MGRNMSAARTDGFIRNIHSRNPFDVIRADVVISRLEKQAHWGCGLHYESKRLVRTVLIFTESSDQLSRATDRVPGLPASPGYVQ